jgi:polysaccharide export outer membrane protein
MALFGSAIGIPQGVEAYQPSQQVATPEGMEAYTLGAGDKLKINVFNLGEISGEYTIGPAGSVAFPLIGDIKAAGLTTVALSDSIRTKLSEGYVKDPNVTIEVLAYRPYYILGEVNHPGEFPYVADITVEQAIAAAGGYTYRASKHSAFLRRSGGRVRAVKFGQDPIYVMPGDTIRIGERYF